MVKDSGVRYDQHWHLLSPTLNLSGFPYTNGCLNTEPACRYPHSVEDSALRNLPFIPHYGFQQSKVAQDLFFHKPHFQQVFAPVVRSVSKEMYPVGQPDIGQQRSPATGTIPSQKRFIIFDRSGDKTTLLYSSRLHTPVHFGACGAPNPPTMHNLSKEERNGYYPFRLSLNDENIEEDLRDVTEDEMHEDTEELDALLCSDDDSDYSEDDEMSTGHSPSTMTDNGIPELVHETGEEVDSFSMPSKRQKLLHGGDAVPSNRYAACSLKTSACSELERNEHKEALYTQSGCKRSRRDEICKTVRMLQGIIPDANGKDAIVVIDQAIHYLRSLKLKAKALGI